MLCDFGLSRAGDGLKSFLTSSQVNYRWLAPERFHEQLYVPTPETDMYEYGLTFCEVNTSTIPEVDEPITYIIFVDPYR